MPKNEGRPDRSRRSRTPLSRVVRRWASASCLAGLVASSSIGCSQVESNSLTEVELGQRLFEDKNLSLRRSQACASCHDAERAFMDARLDEGGLVLEASLGDDGTSIGDRNAPTATYAAFIPPLSRGSRKRHNTDSDIAAYEGYLGGLFLDGRAHRLADQASSPPLNPIEMAMPDRESVVLRLREDPDYVTAFSALYGQDVWGDSASAYTAMTRAIAAFESDDTFASFDSRYDRSLLPIGDDRRYQYDPASKAAFGKALFFSTEFTNCAACHQLHPLGSASADQEIFSGFEYHNIGVPENTGLRGRNGAPLDLGLGAVVGEAQEEGKFRTPTLRNVAVTGPYMHNGVFRRLSTVIRFYEHMRLRSRGGPDDSENPETDEPWDRPEVDRNLSSLELASGNRDLANDENALGLECFLLSLTDARYEHLLDPTQLETCGL